MVNSAGILAFREGRNPLDIARLLISTGAGEIFVGNIDVFTHFRGPRYFFHYLQEQLYPPYHQFPLNERLLVAEQLSDCVWHNIPSLVKLSLGDEGISSEVLKWTNTNGRTLFHCLCSGLASNSAPRPPGKARLMEENSGVELFDEDLDEEYMTRLVEGAWLPWRDLAIEFISAGAALSAVDEQGRTPLCTLIDSFHAGSQIQSKKLFDRLIRILKGWIIDLFRHGVDLQQYGEREKLLRAQSTMAGRHWIHSSRNPRHIPVKKFSFELIAFSFGPRPLNWHFWFAEPSDDYVGIFWALVGDQLDTNPQSQTGPDLPMPGAWVI